MALCSAAGNLLDIMSFTYFFIEEGKGGKVLYTLSTAGSARVKRRSTLFPVCRLIITIVSRSTLFPSCQSISTSSSNSSSSSSRLMVSLQAPSVSDHPFSREI
ncbi:hypothetical protein DY000_02015121 [Brassica cretica]|uniref:Uncharacterized protein n=1 Tax=Brassica cretica TaxID=69181 RepID=A0ABQ7CVM0_BRACR|nr:hypothetical protein DY000_02015121 [Brassica cretica]